MGYYRFETPFGQMALQGEDCLTHLHLPNRVLTDVPSQPTPLFQEAERQLMAYFSAQLKVFDLPLSPTGTPFRELVWKTLEQIPWGEQWSYQKVAQEIGQPKAYRAVGQANHNNPLPILIPCHRVLGIGGRLTGYGGGLPLKQSLLELEGHHFDSPLAPRQLRIES